MPAFTVGESRFLITDYGNSIKFPGDNGSSNQLQKTTPTGITFSKTGSFTIMGMVKTITDESRANKIWRFDSAGVRGYSLILEKSGSNRVFEFQESAAFSTDGFILPKDDYLNKWHWWAITVQGNSSSSVTTHFYWDGIEITTKSANITWSGAVADSSSALRIGDESSTNCPDLYMDEVQYYDRVLAQYEVRQCMFHKSIISDGHCFGYWKMDEGSGTTIADSSGNGNTLTIIGSSAFSTDVFMSNPSRTVAGDRLMIRDFGTCLNFNGSTDYVELTRTGGFPIYNTTGYTIAFWVKQPSVLPDNKYYFSEGSSGGTSPVFGIANTSIASGSTKRISIFIKNSSATTVLLANLNHDVLIPGRWQHIAVTDSAGTIKVYVDSVRVDSGELNYTPSGSFSFNRCGYGALLRNTVAGNFTCKMDEIIAFKMVMTPSEIKTLWQTSTFSTTSLVFYHKLNEGSGTTALDSSGSGNTGTITGATYSTDVVTIPRTLIT